MKYLTHWISRHQLAAFFILTFAMSWGLWFAPGAFMQREQFLMGPLVFVYACSPALAGIIISAVSNRESRQGRRRTFWIAILIAWVICLLVALANSVFISEIQFSLFLIPFFAISVIPVALVIALSYSRIPALRRYLSSLIRLRGVWGWALLAVVFVPSLILLSVPINNFLNGRPLADYTFPELNLSFLGLVIVKFLYQVFFFNATGEEVGWRGFALPRLQARTSPLMAAMVIAIFWVPWHFFFWQAEGKPVMALQFWTDMFLGHILFSIFIVWISNRAGGNILVAGIAHAATNTTFAFLGLQTSLPWLIAALALILVDRMWKKLPTDHPAVVISSEPSVMRLAIVEADRVAAVGA